MESLITKLPYAGPIIAIVIVILGIAAGLYMLDGYRSKKKKEENDGEDRLINILQKTVDNLQTTVTQQTVDIEDLTKEVSDLKKDNQLMREILQGRDGETKEFYKQGFEAMKLTREVHDSMTTIAAQMQTNNENTTKLIGLLEAHLKVLDHTVNK